MSEHTISDVFTKASQLGWKLTLRAFAPLREDEDERDYDHPVYTADVEVDAITNDEGRFVERHGRDHEEPPLAHVLIASEVADTPLAAAEKALESALANAEAWDKWPDQFDTLTGFWQIQRGVLYARENMTALGTIVEARIEQIGRDPDNQL